MKKPWTYPDIVRMAKARQSNPNVAVHETFKALAIMVQEASGCTTLEAFRKIELLAKNAAERVADNSSEPTTTERNRLKIHYEDPPPATGS